MPRRGRARNQAGNQAENQAENQPSDQWLRGNSEITTGLNNHFKYLNQRMDEMNTRMDEMKNEILQSINRIQSGGVPVEVRNQLQKHERTLNAAVRAFNDNNE